MEDVKIPLSADITGLITSLKKGREALKELGFELKNTGATADKSFDKSLRKLGLIENLENKIQKLEQRRDRATRMEGIQGIPVWNKKIAEARKQLDEYKKAGVQASEKINAGVSKTDQLFSKLKSTLLATFSVYAIGNFIKSSVLAYNEQVKGERRLLTALKGRKDYQESIIDQARRLSRITLFGDDATVAAAARMATILKTNKDRIQELLPLIQDFATAKEMDLSTAAELVTKSIDGSVNMLGRYGITLKGASNTSERAKSAIEELSKAVKGQAEAARDADGGVGGLSIAWDHFLTSSGKAFSPITEAVLNSFSDGLDIMTDDYLTFWEKLEALAPGGMGMIKAKVESEMRRVSKETIKAGWESVSVENLIRKKIGKLMPEESQNLEKLNEQLTELQENRKSIAVSDEKGLIANAKEIESLEELIKKYNELGFKKKDEEKKKEKELTAYEQLQKGVSDLEEKLKNEVVTRGKNTVIIGQQLLKKKEELEIYEREIKFLSELTGQIEKLEGAKIDIAKIFPVTDTKLELIPIILVKPEFILPEKTFKPKIEGLKEDILFALNLTEEDFEKIKEKLSIAVGQIKGFYEDLLSIKMDYINKQIDLQNQLITETQNQIQIEQKEREDGYSSSVEGEKQKLQQLQLERTKALAEQKKIQKQQQQIDTLEQVSSLITATANIIKGSSTIPPPLGQILMIAALAAMWGTFIASKAKAAQYTKLAEGGTITGKSHSQGGVKIPGTGIEVEGGEEVINKKTSAKFRPLIKAINKEDFPMVQAILLKEMKSKTGTMNHHVTLDDSKYMKENNELLRNYLSQSRWTDNAGNTYVKKGIMTIKINKN